jgi:hypothetical protein
MNQRLHVRRESMVGFIIFTFLMVIAFIVLSPFAFARFSNVSQFYTVISDFVSSLALVGVVISLLYQARAGHTAREQAIRSLQQQLIKMEMDDPTLMTAIGAPWGLPIPAESARIRDYLYIHMWATFWAGNYVVGELNTAAVRGVARAELLSSEAGRTYWAAVRERVLTTNEGRYLRFARIVDEEYQRMIASNVPVNDPIRIINYPSDSATHWKRRLRHFALVCAAAMIGILAGRRIRLKSIADASTSKVPLSHIVNERRPAARAKEHHEAWIFRVTNKHRSA